MGVQVGKKAPDFQAPAFYEGEFKKIIINCCIHLSSVSSEMGDSILKNRLPYLQSSLLCS